MHIPFYWHYSLVIIVPLAHADFSGPVVGVIDGDTIDVLYNGQGERIRLSGIDCPEKGQAFGNRAKQAASALVFGKDVILHPRPGQVQAHVG